MKSIEQLFADAPKVRKQLQNHEQYFAHTASKNSGNKDELLDEHVELVNTFVQRLCTTHQLDTVVDTLISDALDQATAPLNNIKALKQGIKKRFVYSFLFHDFGKINPNYQREKMKKTHLFPTEVKMPFHPAHGHSELSTYCYLRYFSPKAHSTEELVLFYASLLFCYPIVRHHASNLWTIDKFFENRKHTWIDESAAFEALFAQYQLKAEGELTQFQQYITHVDQILSSAKALFKRVSFLFYSLVKLNFSLLTASDYLATSVHANNKDYVKTGVISEQLRQGIYQAVQNTQPYNKLIFEAASDPTFELQNPRQKGNNFLNRLRQEMGVSVLQQVRQNKEQQIFYIEAPTGGGKTNLSMLASAELLRLKPALNKLIYVFPFTTLVTQTFEALKKTFQLDSTAITQLHSKAGYKQIDTEEKADGFYGDEKQDYLTYLFNHFPVSLCTHIRFFEWLKTEKKELNYIFHRLANSIVVIDELQAYAPHHWDKVMFYIQHFAKYYNTHFIIMSATLPKLGDLLPKLGYPQLNISTLLPNAKDLYFRNPNFRDRVSFNTELSQQNISTGDLAKAIIAASKHYAATNSKYPDSVYCIVECIFKRSASELYEELEGTTSFFDHIWVLSGTILEHRRKQIINRLKNPDYRKKRILLITTQVVEAGVDIDMDIGFKDQSIIDSDEQLAGRINRNVNKDTCKLFLYKKDRASILYKNDLRFEISKYWKASERETMLNDKDFDKLYELVFKNIEKDNSHDFSVNHRAYLHQVKELDFQEISRKFALIEQDNISLFVPIQIPILIESSSTGKTENIFNADELSFLQKNGINDDSFVCGEKVFDLFLKLIKREQNMDDFITNKTNFIRLKAIMSRFIFSMYASNKFEQDITIFLDKDKSEYGYYYISQLNIYDEKIGLLESKMSEPSQQIIF